MKKLLLLHGALGSSAQMEPLADLLRNKFDIYSFDFPGHGGKDFLSESLSISNLSNSVVDFIQQFELENCNVFGYSMGGYIALNMQANKQIRFNKIITLATKYNWSNEIAAIEISKLNPEKIQEKIPSFASQLANRHLPNDWKKLMIEIASLMKDLGEYHLEDSDYKKIQCTVRICIGDRDNMVSVEESLHTYRQLPNGSLSVFSDTSHPFEKLSYDKLASEINQFIS